MAIAYDFDGTLAPGNMQEHQFLPDVGITKSAFWSEVRQLAETHQADEILVYMNLMLRKADQANVSVRRKDFVDRGRDILLFTGVDTWFDRINAYAKKRSVKIEHFLISSGNAEIIAGTRIAKKFRRIYASSFLFNASDVAQWPALAVNYTNKTQFLFRINKGALDVYDKKGVNNFVPEDERPVPFRNIVFLGDGETDIPCFRLLKEKGGLAIAVYRPGSPKGKETSDSLLKHQRVHCAFSADYSEGKALERTIFAKIDEVASVAALTRNYKTAA